MPSHCCVAIYKGCASNWVPCCDHSVHLFVRLGFFVRPICLICIVRFYSNLVQM